MEERQNLPAMVRCLSDRRPLKSVNQQANNENSNTYKDIRVDVFNNEVADIVNGARPLSLGLPSLPWRILGSRNFLRGQQSRVEHNIVEITS